MTREEAIADIRDNIKPIVGGKSLDMAIEALEKINKIDKIAHIRSVEDLNGLNCEEVILGLFKTVLEENLVEKQEPCAYAVSLDAVIDVFDTWWAHNHESDNAIEILEDKLNALPSVTPAEKVGQWIPVSERLPEDLEPVNITWVNHEPEPYYHDIKDRNFVATGIYYRGQWYWYSTTCADYLGEYGSNEIDKVDDAVEIIAWMPLPESYKASPTGGGEQE